MKFTAFKATEFLTETFEREMNKSLSVITIKEMDESTNQFLQFFLTESSSMSYFRELIQFARLIDLKIKMSLEPYRRIGCYYRTIGLAEISV